MGEKALLVLSFDNPGKIAWYLLLVKVLKGNKFRDH